MLILIGSISIPANAMQKPQVATVATQRTTQTAIADGICGLSTGLIGLTLVGILVEEITKLARVRSAAHWTHRYQPPLGKLINEFVLALEAVPTVVMACVAIRLLRISYCYFQTFDLIALAAGNPVSSTVIATSAGVASLSSNVNGTAASGTVVGGAVDQRQTQT